MVHCPKCKSPELVRSRTRNRWETWRKEITHKRPYRCRKCDWRGWRVDGGPDFSVAEIAEATAALAPDPPNLKGTMLARETVKQKLDLTRLDASHTWKSDEPRD